MNYEEFVESRAKDPRTIVADARYVAITHALMGILSELGELTSTLKSHLIYNQDLDVANADEEQGDLEYYLSMLRGCLCKMGCGTRDMILEQNREKLLARYPDGYSDQAAAERADKIS